MLIRICLIVAILAALAAGGLNFVKVKEKITTLATERNTDRDAKTAAEQKTAKAKTDLDKATQELKKSQTELASAKDEQAKAVADAAAQRKIVSGVRDNLSKITQERDDVKGVLARYQATSVSVERILAFDKEIRQTKAAVEEANVVISGLEHKLKSTETELKRYTVDEYVVLLPNLKAKVLVADPKWDFVVLDVGEDQGVLKDGELLVNRDGKLVAKVRVTSIQKNRCIANVVPGWKLGEVVEGDQAIPAHPAS
jgi:hypothetical protein